MVITRGGGLGLWLLLGQGVRIRVITRGGG